MILEPCKEKNSSKENVVLSKRQISINITNDLILFPNYIMAFYDPNLLSALKVQVQIIGAPQIPSTIIATLHYQMVCRVQDHAFNLSKIQTSSNNALVLTINTSQALICSFVPKRISKEDFAKLLLEKWITNYENLQEAIISIQFTKINFTKKADGTIEIKFNHSHLKEPFAPPVFSSMFMIKQTETVEPGSKQKLIKSFDHMGKPIFHFTDPITSHCPWGINCTCEGCQEDGLATNYEMDREKKKKKSKNKPKCSDRELYKKFQDGDPHVGTLGQGGRYQYLVKYSFPEWTKFVPLEKPFQ
ncbi:Polyprotein-like protein, partial [Theobroma cacao]